jgi:phenylpropionate dioxygenase-like ring-hydroxylating dioxygenase large terminal subunit
MGLLRTLEKIRAGYPGGWKQYARGFAGEGTTPPFVQPDDPDDRRSLVPPLGLREYWYVALPAEDVGTKKPVGLRLLGTDLVFFRDKDDEVQALWDYCPHRGAYLSWGDCFWKGYVSCPYHGATFDGNGECVEFITEGPDSRMVGRLQARKLPTRTLKGLVFVWMGEGEPVPIEEDVPPEFFEPETLVQYTFRYWNCNWMIALENTGDAHNCFYVHRNSFRLLRSRLGGRPRTPIGYRVRIVDHKTVVRPARDSGQDSEAYYAVDGKMPYQLYHPRVGGYWPLHRWRLLWSWFFDIFERRKRRQTPFRNPPGWEGQRLPGMVRNNHRTHMYTRWGIPVEPNLTRTVYFFSSRPQTALGRLYDRVSFKLILNWMLFFNFSDQDYDAMRSIRYQYPEYLSSTDNTLVALRKLVTEHARGIQRAAAPEVTAAERLVYEADRLLGAQPDVPVVAGSDADTGRISGES